MMVSRSILERYTKRLKSIVDSPDFELKKVPNLPIIREMFLREEGASPTSAALAHHQWWTLFHKGDPVAVSFTLPSIPGPAPHINWFVPERLWQGYGTIAVVHTGRVFLKKPGAFVIGAHIDNPIGLRQIGAAIRFLEMDKKTVRFQLIFDREHWMFDFLVWVGRKPK